MPLWIPITVVAAILQTTRTAMQQRLRRLLSVSGAGFVRYVYGAPLSLGAIGVIALSGHDLPSPSGRFWPLTAGAGMAQIIGTMLLIRAFDARDYAIGTVYSKTEVVQVALFSLVFLGESLRPLGWIAVVVCLAGIAILATKGGDLGSVLRRLDDRAAVLGMGAGGCLALAAVSIRAASKSLGDDPAIIRALVTLAVMNTIQAFVHGTYLVVREPGQLTRTIRTWRSSSVVGVLSVTGSAGWAWAMTLENAARVRTFGQIELLFTFAIAHFWLHERHGRRELAASGLVAAGVIGVMIYG